MNATEEAANKRNLWDLPCGGIPRCFRASEFPTSLDLIGRPHAVRGFLARVDRRRWLAVTILCHCLARRRPKRRCDGGPPAEPAPNLATREPARPRRRLARPGQPAALIGRQVVRWSFWDARSPLAPREDCGQSACLGKRPAGRSPICVWCCRSPAVTATTEPRGALRASSLRDSSSLRLAPQTKTKKKGRNQRARS